MNPLDSEKPRFSERVIHDVVVKGGNMDIQYEKTFSDDSIFLSSPFRSRVDDAISDIAVPDGVSAFVKVWAPTAECPDRIKLHCMAEDKRVFPGTPQNGCILTRTAYKSYANTQNDADVAEDLSRLNAFITAVRNAVLGNQ